MNSPIHIFCMGKGGVGKSTSAALLSLLMAQNDYNVLIASLDPAHNQSDIFDVPLSEKPRRLGSGLQAIEFDQDKWVRKYLKEVQVQIERTYSYVSSFNLEQYFKVIRYSPGLEEYALVLAFNHTRQAFKDLDFLIFDMPPTALSLKFFSLPSLSLIWIEQLLDLRREIIKKRELITRIKFAGKEIERDKVLNKILALKDQYTDLQQVFEDRTRTRIKLVLNPDRLSFNESLRILKGLQALNLGPDQIINNKMLPGASCADIDPAFDRLPMLNFPFSKAPLIGINNLQAYIEANHDIMEQQLNICTLHKQHGKE